MKWYYTIAGGHTHVRVFMNGAKCGDLCFRNEEFQTILKAPPTTYPLITFFNETPVAMPLETTKWIIWSNKHNAWWRKNSCGYTMNIAEAGVYTKAAALEIARKANEFCHPDKLNEVAIPDFRELEAEAKRRIEYLRSLTPLDCSTRGEAPGSHL